MSGLIKEVRFVPLAPWQKAAIDSPFMFTAMFGGIASLKTATAAHFIIKQVLERPHLTGFAGANSYDQLNQTFLRECFKWFQEYGFEYVIDRIPPLNWGVDRKFKSYRNILTIWNPWARTATTIFTRILSEPDNFRGLTLSWAVLDETRDTEEYAFDILLSRLRESDYMRILICTTTNGEDWVHKRFVKMADKKLYGSMHIPTIESVKLGIITQQFYDSLKQSYTELMVEQELEARHVNIGSGRAYYSAGEWNKNSRAPWGDRRPDPARPLIVGCDFNFAPAPCVWTCGQQGPDEWNNQIHWFREISASQTSTESMTLMLLNQFPDFFYRIFGDASGNRGTTSNAGYTDYNRIANILSENGCQFSIDVEQSNPLVKDRIENMNSLFRNALGEVRQTYNPSTCPLLDDDVRIVGWKKKVNLTGQGRLDDCGDHQRTHATDAAGYACWKLFPPGRKGRIVETNRSAIRQSMMDEVNANGLAPQH